MHVLYSQHSTITPHFHGLQELERWNKWNFRKWSCEHVGQEIQPKYEMSGSMTFDVLFKGNEPDTSYFRCRKLCPILYHTVAGNVWVIYIFQEVHHTVGI